MAWHVDKISKSNRSLKKLFDLFSLTCFDTLHEGSEF